MPRGVPKNKSFQRRALHRLKIARGHLNKVIDMMAKDEYCIDIIHQSKAVQSALKKIDQELLKNHMKTCVIHSIKKGHTHEVINEVMKVMEKN